MMPYCRLHTSTLFRALGISINIGMLSTSQY